MELKSWVCDRQRNKGLADPVKYFPIDSKTNKKHLLDPARASLPNDSDAESIHPKARPGPLYRTR